MPGQEYNRPGIVSLNSLMLFLWSKRKYMSIENTTGCS